MIDDKTVETKKIPIKIVNEVKKAIDKQIDTIVEDKADDTADKKGVKIDKRTKIMKFDYYKSIKDFRVKDIVKIGCEHDAGFREAFHVIITKISGKSITGLIDNDLKRPINGKNYKDTIKLNLTNIYDVYNGA